MSSSHIQFNNLTNIEEINSRLFSRNIPSVNNLKQYPITALAFRPSSTKYQLFPTTSSVPLENSIMNQPPTQLIDVNGESYLQNRFFALQSCPQAYYIPDTTSELYNYNVEPNIKPDNVLNQYPYLFTPEKFGYFNPNPHSAIVGNTIFNNHTRNQMKNISE